MNRRHLPYYLAALVFLITFAVYLSALRNDFVNWDDDVYVYNNPNIRSLSFAFLRKAFFDFYEANWIPLTWTSHALDYAMWGLNPLGHHLTNNILHAANTSIVVILIIGLLRAAHTTLILPGGGTGAGLTPVPNERAILITASVTGVLFGLHPLHVESAAWVAERKDLLCALFFLLSLMMYTRYAAITGNEPKQPYFKARLINKYYLLSLGFSMLALLSKPMAVTLPVVLLILDWYPFKRIGSLKTFQSAFIEKLPFIAFSLISTLLTVLAQRAGGAIGGIQPPLSTRMLVAARSLMAYLYHMILPVNLMPYYPYPKEFSSPVALEHGIFAALVIGITITVIMRVKKEKIGLAIWCCYVITLLPVLGIMVQAGTQAMADRYTYLPSLGPFLLIGSAAAWVWTKTDHLGPWGPAAKGAAAVVALSIGISLTYLTLNQIAIWKNSIDLWSYVINKEPDRVPFAYNNRGLAFRERGQFDLAMEDFNKAITLDPTFANAYTSRGWTFKDMGQIDRAMDDYNRAISLDPTRYIAYNNRGMVYRETGRIDSALSDFTASIALNPSFAQAYTNRGLAFGQVGQLDRALEDYTAAITADPYFSNAYNNRGLVYERTGLLDQALEDFNAAIRLDPSGVEAYNNRGLVYEDLGRFDRAIEDYTTAIELKPDDYLSYSNRGIALGKMGRFDKAVEDHTKAITLKPEFVKGYLDRGNCYREHGNLELAVRDYQKACQLGAETGCRAVRTFGTR